MRSIRLLTVLVLLSAAGPLSAQIARRPFLFKDARRELAAARARGDSTVLLVIASMPGRNAAAARVLTGMGGTIQYRADEVDYLARTPAGGQGRDVRGRCVRA